jgi:dihydroflavonol-4-reductase
MKVLVTGATGHIGGNMVRILHERGFNVVANYRNGHKLKEMERFGVEWVQGDVLDQAFLKKATKGIDVVVNLAARISISGDPKGEVMKTNVEGPANVVAACLHNNVPKLIHFSSIHAFKFSGDEPAVNEDSPRADHTSFVYDQSKIGGEMEIQKGVEAGLNAVILNPTGVLGPFNYWHSFTGQMLKDLYSGRLPALVKAAYNWVDTRDLVEATIQSISKGETGKNYILAGHNMTLKTIAALVNEFGGKKPPLISVSLGVAKLGLPFLSLYSKLTNSPPLYTDESLTALEHYNSNISNAKAKNDLNFNPRPMEETIKDSIEWYEKQGLITRQSS